MQITQPTKEGPAQGVSFVYFLIMRNFLIICLLFAPLRAWSQEDGAVVFRNSLELTHSPVPIEASIVRDSIDYVIDYTVYYVPDTTDTAIIYEDLYRLDIGRQSTRFYGRIEYLSDSLTSAWKRYGRPNDHIEKRRALRGYHPLYWEITEDRNHASLTTTYRYPSYPPIFYAYTTDKEQPRWTQTHDDVREICGYRCYQARTSFGGRQWIVYFAPDLPLNSAVWKFFGLPGLVLAFEDIQGYYKFECTDIRACKRPMIEYKKPIRQVSRKHWRQLIEGIHVDPLNTLEKGNTVYYKPTPTEEAKLLTSWSIPYNPIELE